VQYNGDNPIEMLGRIFNQTLRTTREAFSQAGTLIQQQPETQAFSQFLAAHPAHQYNSQYVPVENIPQQYKEKGGATGTASFRGLWRDPTIRPPVGYGPAGYQPYERAGNDNFQNPELALARQRQNIVAYMGSTGKLPAYLNAGDLGYMRNNGLDTGQLAQFYTFDPKTGQYTINQNGQTVNQNVGVVGQIQPGTYIDPGTGEVKRGTTPYGTNAAGQRLDVSGNVWDPKTATRDIYGGQFIQVGEKRWERNSKGKLVKVQYGKGGKKKVISGGGHNTVEEPAPAPAPKIPGMQSASTKFNVASG
jgi:hypothetical protein